LDQKKSKEKVNFFQFKEELIFVIRNNERVIFSRPSFKAGHGQDAPLSEHQWEVVTIMNSREGTKLIVTKPKANTVSTSYLNDVICDG
jgi:hypothetical protein